MNIKYHYLNSYNYVILFPPSHLHFSVFKFWLYTYTIYIYYCWEFACFTESIVAVALLSGCMVVHDCVTWYSYYCRLYSDKDYYLYSYRLVCSTVRTLYLYTFTKHTARGTARISIIWVLVLHVHLYKFETRESCDNKWVMGGWGVLIRWSSRTLVHYCTAIVITALIP
jgi:hypothetical protein